MWLGTGKIAALWAVLAMCSYARADLTGLVVFREGPGGGGAVPPGPERWIYRVYAEFTDPSDRVGSWGVGSTLGPGQISNITADGSLGSGFTNIPDNDFSNTAPQLPFFPTDWDTYMTIGVLYGIQGPSGVDGTQVWPGTPTFITDGATTWTGNPGFVSLQDVLSPQGRADYRVVGNDTDRRVLLMQLVVNSGEHVQGTIGLLVRTQAGAYFATDVPFTSIPTTPSLACFIAAVVIAERRKR